MPLHCSIPELVVGGIEWPVDQPPALARRELAQAVEGLFEHFEFDPYTVSASHLKPIADLRRREHPVSRPLLEEAEEEAVSACADAGAEPSRC